MLSRFRRERAAAPGLAGPQRIEADLSGAVIDGQVAIGEHIVQIHADHGAVVNYLPPPQRPVTRLRAGPIRRLPRDFPLLLGREPEVAVAFAQRSSGASVEFFGSPGIGKTALLRHLAHRLGDQSAGAVVFTWCGGQPVADLQQFVFECLYESDSQVVPTPSALATYLRDQPVLLLLDDVELERSELGRLMDSVPAGLCVCSSPARRLWGEGRAVAMPGLSIDAGLALFERELGRPLEAGERAAAERLDAVLDGHPLDILEAAAAFAASPPAAAHRPQAAGSAELLEALGALPGVPVATIDLAGATGLADAAQQLAALEARHLVQAHSPRYSLTGDRAIIDDETATRWRQRLLTHFVVAGGAVTDDRAGARRAEYAAPAVLALLAWAEETRRPAEVLALARAVDGMLALGARWGAWGVALEHALRAARSLGDRASEAWALHQLGSRALCLEDAVAAAASLTSALELRERLGDEPGAALTRHNLSLLDGGGPPQPPRDGGWPPRPPRIALLLVLGALALVAGISAAAVVSGDPTRPGPPLTNAVAPTATTTSTATSPPDTTSSATTKTSPPNSTATTAPLTTDTTTTDTPNTTTTTTTTTTIMPPHVAITSPADPSSFDADMHNDQGDCKQVSFSAAASGGRVRLTYSWTDQTDNGSATLVSTELSPALTLCAADPSKDAIHQLTLTATDESGTTSPPATVRVTVVPPRYGYIAAPLR